MSAESIFRMATLRPYKQQDGYTKLTALVKVAPC